MRIFLTVVAVVVILIVVAYLMGRLRTTWLGYSPLGWGLLLLLGALLGAAGWHLWEMDAAPKRHYEPARMENGRIIPERFY
ncbi:MAG: hypothetical protein HQL60_03830 [Magnetococcales bacterium]|nr:hypothetical protein [Magnetococcales bacterium]